MGRILTMLATWLLISQVAALAVEPKKTVHAILGADGVQRAEVLGGGYFFNPDHIVVKVQVPVELKVRKESGIVPHDLVIKEPEAGIDVEVSLSSDPKTVSFTPTKTGKYPIYCSKKPWFLPSHREKGMEGVLEVVE